jgi:hypothetical protein
MYFHRLSGGDISQNSLCALGSSDLYILSPLDILFAPVREVIFDAMFMLYPNISIGESCSSIEYQFYIRVSFVIPIVGKEELTRAEAPLVMVL